MLPLRQTSESAFNAEPEGFHRT